MAEKMTVFEMARKYYPLLWDINRIDSLFKAGKLTEEERKEIVEQTKEEKANN